MSNLIRFEFRKLFHHVSFYVIMGVSLLFTIVNGLLLLAAARLIDMPIPTTIYDFVRGSITSNSMIFVGIFLAIFTTEDFNTGSIKNIVSRGYSNSKVYFSKYLVSLIAVIAICLTAVIGGIIYGLIFFPEVGSFKDIGFVIPGLLLCIVTYHALFFLVSFSMRKMAPAIVISIVGPMGLDLVIQLVSIFTEDRFKINIANYWLSGILTNFGSSLGDDTVYVAELIWLVVYLVGFVLVGYLINRNREIK